MAGDTIGSQHRAILSQSVFSRGRRNLPVGPLENPSKAAPQKNTQKDETLHIATEYPIDDSDETLIILELSGPHIDVPWPTAPGATTGPAGNLQNLMIF
jgi:hypothetical protein